MTHYIGDVPITSIQNFSISKSENNDEIDIIDSDSNVVFEGAESAEEVEISFTLLKQRHPERIDVETQRSETKELASNDVADNYFEYNGTEYFLSVGEVSVPEDSTLDTIREGTITATALTYPKNQSNSRTGNNKRLNGEVVFVMDLSAQPEIVTLFPSGEVDYNLDVEIFSNLLLSSVSEIDYSLDVTGDSDVNKSGSGEVDYTLSLDDVIADMKYSSVGCVQFSLDVNSDSSLLHNSESDVDYSLDVVGSLDGSIYGMFGRVFGRNFGGN